MKIILAGYNTDKVNEKTIETPETISAAYARISRSELSVDQLRKNAAMDVDKARKSNKNIIFSLGHSSVAEHAVFNFDLIDISRFAAEYIQHHRLASFTEKSQRYVSFGDNYILPRDIDEKMYIEKLESFFRTGFNLYRDILNECSNASIDGYAAKEDARYALPLATKTQMGMTVNARTLEYMISDLHSQGIDELEKIADSLYEHAHRLAPSIIKYAQGREGMKKKRSIAMYKRSLPVTLIDHTDRAEEKIISSIIFEDSGVSINKARKMAQCGRRRKRILKSIFGKMEMWDRPPRAFELANFTFHLSLSASAFAQIKRHRMASIIAQGYSAGLRPVIPETIINTGFGEKYLRLGEQSADMMMHLGKKYGNIAYYAALNGTRRDIVITMNARELYHFFRLRSDEHAQWEIREISEKMLQMVSDMYPLLFAYAGGKHRFDEIRGRIERL